MEMASGVRPSMRLASSPIARTSPLARSMAMTDGSRNIMPFPRT